MIDEQVDESFYVGDIERVDNVGYGYMNETVFDTPPANDYANQTEEFIP